MSINNKPIGFFDSGVGGISVLKESLKVLPKENYIYLGDNKHAPYGNKSEDEIKRYSLECASFLFDKGVKAIVIACNTATSISVKEMREKYNIPVISIEPAVKPALENTTEGRLLVLATPATLSQARYKNLLMRMGDIDRVVNVPCPGLADLIEKNDPNDIFIRKYLESILKEYSDDLVSGIVLGCTHYSLIESQILEVAKNVFNNLNIRIFDGRFGVANHLKELLQINGLLNDSGSSEISFYATGNQEEILTFKKYISR